MAVFTQAEVSPYDLLGPSGKPRPLRLAQTSAESIAQEYSLRRSGDNISVTAMSPLSTLRAGQPSDSVSYLSDARYAQSLQNVKGAVVITSERLKEHVPEGNTLLLTGTSPKELFYTIFSDKIKNGQYEVLRSHISPRAVIAETARIDRNVYIEDDVVIGEGVVVLANTYLGSDVVIKPNATVGGDGFEPVIISGKRVVCKHAGGVWLEAGVQIGSSTCVDKGLFGDFTYLGGETLVDNLVHVGHSATVGKGTSICACAEIGGTITIEEGVWIAPNVTTNQLIKIGAHSFIGFSSLVKSDIPAHGLAYGVPAVNKGWVCRCKARLNFSACRACCESCGRNYIIEGNEPVVREYHD